MPKKIAHAKKSSAKKTFLEKVEDKASNLKDDIAAGKNHLVEFAGEAFDTIKKGMKHLVETGKTKNTPKKKAVKKSAAKRIMKKAPVKKVAAKTIKKSNSTIKKVGRKAK